MSELPHTPYRFERPLGQGGFGRVFLAREEISSRLVAIKQLNDQDEKQQKVIIHEIRMVAQFYHQNIVTYHHHYCENGLLFLVMEYCSGGSLRDLIRRKKMVSAESIRLVCTLAEALDVVHKAGVVHHDIKPDNILFTEQGVVKISDFGIANTGGGTLAYMSPEALCWDHLSVGDTRVDIYALGVTLLELLTGSNPFSHHSVDEIRALHDQGDLPIKSLPDWQQEIILKAINKVPELRFQSMAEFAGALRAKHVPLILNRDVIKAGEIAEQAERSLATKKWVKAGSLLEFAAEKFPENVNVLKALGKYYLLRQKIQKAREQYDKALRLNPRLDVQKDLGWIELELKNYPSAISLLSDHVHRNPSDFEAYNLLMQCFYETGRYEVAMSVGTELLGVDSLNPCFANNLYIASILHHNGSTLEPASLVGERSNAFLNYNHSVVVEAVPTHGGVEKPTLKSKLLFMDYRFRKLIPGTIYCSTVGKGGARELQTREIIITFGRTGYHANDVEVADGTAVSRRHCLIVNCKDDAWLYDLQSTGTYLDNRPVKPKEPFVGLATIRIGGKELAVSTDKEKLL